FYDRLKSVSSGYASFDYQIDKHETGDLVNLSILVNAEPVDALACIVHRGQAEARGRALCERLKELIPRQLFKIAIQAAIGGRRRPIIQITTPGTPSTNTAGHCRMVAITGNHRKRAT